MDLNAPSPFSVITNQGKKIDISDDIDIVFVSDMFVEDYPFGGAELSTAALIDSSPFKILKVHSKDVTIDLLERGHHKFWIFGNYASLDLRLIPSIIANMRYSIIEYDYKFCRYRSMEKHRESESRDCDCHNAEHGKLISAFMHGANSLWFMSEAQLRVYTDRFPFLMSKKTTVLSSIFDDQTLATIKLLREGTKNVERKGWLVLGSNSWVKGMSAAEQWCKDNDKDYTVLWNVPYADVLKAMSEAEGFVYLPAGSDTCPRMTIEAKLLGCDLVINGNVQHASEEWFTTDDVTVIESYLYMARDRFWNGIEVDMSDDDTTLSGYTTTYNCIESGYPYEAAIMSMCEFCDEVVVLDAGSTDGTWERINELSQVNEKIRPYRFERDRSSVRWAIEFDGKQKALARSLCRKAYCWQQDVDEILHEDDYEKLYKLIRRFPKNVDLMALPVIEYWGSSGKVRCDIHNWKWRLSRNRSGITHGIPRELRRYDDEGRLYAAKGTDSCDYVWIGDYSRVKFINFYDQRVEEVRRKALTGDVTALHDYERWYDIIVDKLPCVHHYSWYDMKRKIMSYRSYWRDFWSSMYGESVDDTPENNMFFDKKWSDVTDDDIDILARRLTDELGGWVFHEKVDFDRSVPYIKCSKGHPAIIRDWLAEHTTDSVRECS